MTRPITVAAVVAALAVALPATASAQGQSYPPPSNPGSVQKKPKGPFKTLRVGKRERYKTIQSAVNAAKPGDTIRIRPGVYRESVRVNGARKRYIKIIGDPRRPHRVVLEGSNRLQNGIQVNGADAVTIRGIKARRYRANGFFVINVTGYAMDRLIAELPGTYGLYAFNSKGGSMTNSLSYLAADGSYYVGQTPAQTNPQRTIIRNVIGWGSVIGYTGTNSRYVTVTNSKFFNNAVGVAPNSLDSEKFPPNESNVFRGNEVFWNNFDVYRGKPPYKPNRSEDFVYPAGTGIFLLSGRDNIFENNKVYGNFLMGMGVSQNPFLEPAEAQDLLRNRFNGNVFGKGGTDLNGRDAVYSTNGTGNCFSNNEGMTNNIPADPAKFPACPFDGKNPEDPAGLLELAGWATGNSPTYRQGWIAREHAPRPDGIVPIDGEWKNGRKYGPKTL
jgi:hypothetical protein